MRRHKPPTLVSMWMLDVFCCALGCVTLLWLLNTRSAADEVKRTEAARSSLQTAQDELAATRRTLTADIDNLKAKLVATTAERDEAAKQLAVARTDVDALQTKLAKADAQADRLIDELAKRQAAADALAKKLTTTAASAEDLARLLRAKEAESAALAVKAKKADEDLHDLDARLRALTKANDAAKSDMAAMRKSGDELADARQKLGDAQTQIIDLQGEKKKLADQIDRLRTDADTRFAGIATTGRRVCFVVDISGSMKLLDDKTPAPQKWPTVAETVAKVMRSVVGLERYQVVVFSRQARFLFGSSEWQPFQGETSVARVKEALLAVEPVGDTNMYEAFDTAFRLKPLGLDTVYLFSDGLPTSGAGLTPEQERSFADPQRTEVLSRHVRQTLMNRLNPPGPGRVKIHAIGFFFESPEVGAFLWALARDNDGSFVGMSRP